MQNESNTDVNHIDQLSVVGKTILMFVDQSSCDCLDLVALVVGIVFIFNIEYT